MEKCIEYNVQTGETIESEIDIVLPNPRIFEIKERTGEIDIRLDEIDLESMRPIRASLMDVATDYDRNKLDALETEAVSLRTERTEIQNELKTLEVL